MNGKKIEKGHRVTAKHKGKVYMDIELKDLMFICLASSADLSYDPDVPPWWAKPKTKR